MYLHLHLYARSAYRCIYMVHIFATGHACFQNEKSFRILLMGCGGTGARMLQHQDSEWQRENDMSNDSFIALYQWENFHMFMYVCMYVSMHVCMCRGQACCCAKRVGDRGRRMGNFIHIGEIHVWQHICAYVCMYVCMRVRVYGRQECSGAKRTLSRRIKYVGDSGAQLCQLVQDEWGVIWFMSHMRMSHGTCIHESCHTCEWGVSRRVMRNGMTSMRGLCICMRIHMYVHVYVRICIYTFEYMCIYTYTYIHTYTHTYTYIHTHAQTYLHIYIYIHIDIYMNILVYMYAYTWIYMYIHVYINIHIYT